jgi:hypothetical protein
MPITTATIQNTPIVIAPAYVTEAHTALPHRAHDPTDRKTEVVTPQPNGLATVGFTNNAHGHVYYLPFAHNEVRSIRLPANPGFNAVVLTANLDGCWMFVDRKNNGDVIVYHANASGPAYAPTAQQSATTPLFQTAAAQNQLQNLYQGAAAHYAGTPTTVRYVLRKSRYLQEVDARLQHKAAQGRTGVNYAAPEHASFTTFAGFYLAGHWEFWFQTYSQFIYRRPKMHIKSVFGHRSHDPHVTHDPYEIVEAVRWVVL